MEFLAVAPEVIPSLADSKTIGSPSLNLASQLERDGYEPPDGEPALPDWGFRFRDYSVDAAAELGLFFGSTEAKFMRRLVIYEWQKYRDVKDDDEIVRWGVAIRVRMNVLKKSAAASLSNIFNLTASASAGHVETTVEIDNLGIQSATVEGAIPIFNSLTADSFVELQHAFTKALPELTRGDDLDFTPRVLSVWGTADDANERDRGYREAIATAWAIDRLARGKRLREATEAGDGEFRAIVQAVYSEMAQIQVDQTDARPTDIVKAKAKAIIGKLGMDD